jgi:hypothetical protein
MNYLFREETHLSETEGKVISYSEKVPEVLQRPLKISEQGIPSRRSGRRNALIKISGHWYKLKGFNPQPGLFSTSDWMHELKNTELDIPDNTMKPKGAMCDYSVEVELKQQDMLVEKLKEFRLTAPLYPVAKYDYGMGDRYCAVSVTTGDLRLSEFLQKASVTPFNMPDYKNQFELMYQWFGFAQHIVKETFGKLGGMSNGISNYVFYDVDGGYGISRVDFPKRSEKNRLIRPNPVGYMEQCVVEFLRKTGNSSYLEKVLSDPVVKVVSSKSKKIGVFKKGGKNRGLIVYVPENMMPKQGKMLQAFAKGLNAEIPKPVSKKFISSIY